MIYNQLIFDGTQELPLFAKEYVFADDFKEVSLTSSNICRKNKWDQILYYGFSDNKIKLFSYGYNRISNCIIPEGVLLFSSGFIALKHPEGYEVLYVRTLSNNIYISKNIRKYKTLWNKIGKEITKILEEDEDVILTNDCGKNIFITFEKPKFKSIQEREDYCNSLLQEVLI